MSGLSSENRPEGLQADILSPASIDMVQPSKAATRPYLKRLPWLDGKSSLTISPTATTSPLVRAHGRMAEQAPNLPSIKSAVSPLSVRLTEMPAFPRPTVGTSDADSVLYKQPEPRPQATSFLSPSAARSLPTPVNHTAHHLPPASSHAPAKRLSIINIQDPDVPFEAHRPRAESLAPVPDHLEIPESPESEECMVQFPQREIHMASPPHVVKTVHMSPSQPAPKTGPFTGVNSRQLSNTVEALESTVRDAVSTAQDTNDPDQLAELYAIVEDARAAIQEAIADPVAVKTSPLTASDSSGISGFSSNFLAEKEIQPLKPTYSPPIPSAPGLHSVIPTAHPEHPGSVDWAYHHGKDLERDGGYSSVSSSDLHKDRSRSPHSARSALLPAPNTSQLLPQDRLDHVVSPAAVFQDQRGRSRHRRRHSPEPKTQRRGHQNNRYSHHERSRSLRRRRQQKRVQLRSYDKSFEEDDLHAAGKPHGIRRLDESPPSQDGENPHTFSLRRYHRRQPIARNWRTGKKRLTALIACINTALLGIIVGIYAGEVPCIQYVLADESHRVIIGNVGLYAGLAISTLVSWPLPLLHGRKPYILASLMLAMPLQFPQALVVSVRRSPKDTSYIKGLLFTRAFSGIVLGFANVNYIGILLDLFGASLQSKHPHQEFAAVNDIRRHGGGMGMWLGIWSWCSIGSLAVGFQVGAGIIEVLTPDWGFYIVIIILAIALILNVVAPETRRSAYRQSVTEVYDADENYITRRVARGEIKLHISTEGPLYWFEEVWAGMKLSAMMVCQPGFLALTMYLGWIYSQIVLIIMLLGALLSRDYRWKPRFVGLGVMSIAIGALLAIPLTKAGVFSRSRKRPARTDSMTFEKQISWSSHFVRRVVFTLALPLMGTAYTVSSAGVPKPYMVPIVFAGAVGFFSLLAIAECHGIIMETFDTCDLQPGVNTKHRLQSMAVEDRRRRTNYSSFPRVSAGIFVSQTFGFIGAAIATQVGGVMTRRIGAQASTAVTAGTLLFLTLLLTLALTRFKRVQVIPNHTFGTRRDTAAWNEFKELEKEGRGADWKAVVIGTPSGKMRRMNILELGRLSRWTEIRKLNFLIRDDTTRDEWHGHGHRGR